VTAAPTFDAAFRERLDDLFAWRRDVRRFVADVPVAPAVLHELLAVTRYAPSVGFSQPARFVDVRSPERRAAVRELFSAANAEALAGYDGERSARYAGLKLAGLDEAPVHLAVFCDEATETGAGLGAQSMPEMRAYSVVLTIHTLWLAARARGLGLGWVSILDAAAVGRTLAVDPAWRLVGYLCLGRPQEEHLDRELERAGWERPDARSLELHER